MTPHHLTLYLTPLSNTSKKKKTTTICKIVIKLTNQPATVPVRLNWVWWNLSFGDLVCSLKQWMTRAHSLTTEQLRGEWCGVVCCDVMWSEVRRVDWCGLISPDVWYWVCRVMSVYCVLSSPWLYISLSQCVVCNWGVLAVELQSCRTGHLSVNSPNLTSLTTSVCLPSAPTLRNILTNKLSLYISLLGAKKSFIQTFYTNSLKLEMLLLTHITCLN